MSNQELMNIIGGGITAAMVNGVVGAFKFIYSVGKDFGSSMYRFISKNYC